MASKSKAEKDAEAKENAKATAQAKRADVAAELDKPLSPEEQAALGGGEQPTEEGVSDAHKLAAKGLKDGTALSADEVQAVSAEALRKGDGVDEDAIARRVVKELTEAFEKEIKHNQEALAKFDLRIKIIEQAVAKLGGKGVLARKDDTQFGSIDTLGSIDDLKA